MNERGRFDISKDGGKKTAFLHLVELLETTFRHTQGVQYWNLRPGEGAVS